jgi:predicted phosphoribosyltransferase
MQELRVVRSEEGVSVVDPPYVAGREVIVIDDGVETGTAARAIALALRDQEPARLILAVPVCPRQESASLALLYDEVIAVVQPLARRSLRWHYVNAEWLN